MSGENKQTEKLPADLQPQFWDCEPEKTKYTSET